MKQAGLKTPCGEALLIASASNYAAIYEGGGSAAPSPAAECDAQLAAAESVGYAGILQAHLADHGLMYRRASVELGRSNAAALALPTPERLQLWAEFPGLRAAHDPELAALY